MKCSTGGTTNDRYNIISLGFLHTFGHNHLLLPSPVLPDTSDVLLESRCTHSHIHDNCGTAYSFENVYRCHLLLCFTMLRRLAAFCLL